MSDWLSRIIWVDPSPETDALAELQASLRRKISARALTVEANPTSNLLIGDLGDLTAHPLWRLRPPRGEGDAPPVSICVGSDDPLVFGSNLRQEYQFLSDPLTLAGLSDEEARQWLDHIRVCGLSARFTLARTDECSISDLLIAKDLPNPWSSEISRQLSQGIEGGQKGRKIPKSCSAMPCR